jgi:hypothetical protein
MAQQFIRCGKWGNTSTSPDAEEVGVSVLTVADEGDNNIEVFSYPYIDELVLGKEHEIFLVTGDVIGSGYDGEDLLGPETIKVIGYAFHVDGRLFKAGVYDVARPQD